MAAETLLYNGINQSLHCFLFLFYVNHQYLNPYMQLVQALPSHRKNPRYSMFGISAL